MTAKILLSVNFPGSNRGEGNKILLCAWDNFMKHNRSKLQCDSIFTGSRYNPSDFARLSPNCETWVPDYPEGWYLDYPSIAGADGYDFVIRMDHDSFTSASSINSICEFIQENQDIDIISASNAPRGLNIEHPVAREIFREPIPGIERQAKSFMPWGIPTTNGDLLVMNRRTYMHACSNYIADERLPCKFKNVIVVKKKNRKYAPWRRHSNHMLTHKLTYGEVCDLLEFEDPRITDEVRKTRAYIDGTLHSDLWAHFCALKPKMAGILDGDGRSFKTRNLLREFGEALKAEDYFSARDAEDISFPHEKNVKIDHLFHLEGGYTTAWYFNTMGEDGNPNDICSIYQTFKKPTFSPYMAYYAIIKMFTERFDDVDGLKTQLAGSMNEIYKYFGTNTKEVDRMTSIISSFYEDALKEYLQ
jgi:hypothetical protein